MVLAKPGPGKSGADPFGDPFRSSCVGERPRRPAGCSRGQCRDSGARCAARLESFASVPTLDSARRCRAPHAGSTSGDRTDSNPGASSR
jgi:hypothetical protein